MNNRKTFLVMRRLRIRVFRLSVHEIANALRSFVASSFFTIRFTSAMLNENSGCVLCVCIRFTVKQLIVPMCHTRYSAQAPTIQIAAVFSFMQSLRKTNTIKIKFGEHETILYLTIFGQYAKTGCARDRESATTHIPMRMRFAIIFKSQKL